MRQSHFRQWAADAAREAWKLLRALSTDDAYEAYLAHQRTVHPQASVLDRHDFFILQQRRKWTGIKRCC